MNIYGSPHVPGIGHEWAFFYGKDEAEKVFDFVFIILMSFIHHLVRTGAASISLLFKKLPTKELLVGPRLGSARTASCITNSYFVFRCGLHYQRAMSWSPTDHP